MIRTPKGPTLRRYGLTLLDWKRMLQAQGGVCAVCKREPPSGLLTIDHEHVPSWRNLPPEQRKLYVRGLVCWMDNRFFLARGQSVERALSIAAYLRAYEARRPLAPVGLARPKRCRAA